MLPPKPTISALNIKAYSFTPHCPILSLDIAHRDLKPENILCEKEDEVNQQIYQCMLLW